MNNKTLFNMVANERNWKLPINKEVTIQETIVPSIVDAIKHFTGDIVVEVTKITETQFRFVSGGFYNMHGDPENIPDDINDLA